jgi:hypothetical protein
MHDTSIDLVSRAFAITVEESAIDLNANGPGPQSGPGPFAVVVRTSRISAC